VGLDPEISSPDSGMSVLVKKKIKCKYKTILGILELEELEREIGLGEALGDWTGVLCLAGDSLEAGNFVVEEGEDGVDLGDAGSLSKISG
jgi:hypothetical protein